MSLQTPPAASRPAAYERPAGLTRALELRADPAFRILGGATDLFAMTEARELAGPLLDVTAVEEMRALTFGPDGMRIGAAVTWAEIARAQLPPACDGLRAAARQVGSAQIQSRGTVGGNLVNASPAADGVPPLLTLEAEVELASLRGARRLPLSQFLLGVRRTALAEDELLVSLHIPAAALEGQGAFEKLGARAHLVISIAMVAARIEVAHGHIASAALAVGACSPVAQRLPALEAALKGAPLSALPDAGAFAQLTASALSPIDDVRADAGYRLAAAPELARRAVLACAASLETV